MLHALKRMLHETCPKQHVLEDMSFETAPEDQKILPGLSRPAGSRTALIPRIRATSVALRL